MPSALGCIALHCLTVFVSYKGSLPTVPKIGNSYLICQIGDSGGLGMVVPLIYRTSGISLVTDLANLLNNKQPSSLLLSYPFRLSFLKSILILPFRHSLFIFGFSATLSWAQYLGNHTVCWGMNLGQGKHPTRSNSHAGLSPTDISQGAKGVLGNPL